MSALSSSPATRTVPSGAADRGSWRSRLRSRAGLLAVSGGAVLWGTTGVAVQIVHDRTGLSAVPIGWLRLAIAAAAMLLFALITSRLSAQLGLLRRRPVAATLAGAGLALYQVLYFVGVQDVGVSVATLVSLSVAPIALTLAGVVRRRKAPGAGRIAILVAALAGLTLVCLRPGAATGTSLLVGMFASLGSGLFYAATTVLNRGLAADNDPLTLTGLTAAVGAVVLLPFALASASMGGSSLFWPADRVASFWLLYIGVVSTCVAYALFYLGLRSVHSEVAGVLTLLEPATAAVLAGLALGEHLTLTAWLGAGLLLLAVAGLYVGRPDAPPAIAAEPPGG